MRNYTTLIDILYNPASYCHKTWQELADTPCKNFSTLPAYIKNIFILRKVSFHTEIDPNIIQNQTIMLFTQNWSKIKRSAYLIGLKLLSASIIKHPLFLQNIKSEDRAFFLLPISLSLPVMTLPQNALIKDDITQAGASFIYSLAGQVLPPFLLERLQLIFPTSCNFEAVPCDNVDRSLSALKWAFDHA